MKHVAGSPKRLALVLAWAVLALGGAAAAEPGRDDAALAVSGGGMGAVIYGDSRSEKLELYAEPPGDGAPSSPPAEEGETETWPRAGRVWIDRADGEMTDYERSRDPEAGVVTASFRHGGAKITERIFMAERYRLLVAHLRADMPGALSFRVRLDRVDGPVDTRIEGRRGLVMEAQGTAAGVRAWVLPMEADVSTEGDAVAVRGGGEVLILIAAGPDDELSGRLKPLGFGDGEFPDLGRVKGELEKARRDVE